MLEQENEKLKNENQDLKEERNQLLEKIKELEKTVDWCAKPDLNKDEVKQRESSSAHLNYAPIPTYSHWSANQDINRDCHTHSLDHFRILFKCYLFSAHVATMLVLCAGLTTTASSKLVILTLLIVTLVPEGSIPSVLKGKVGIS
jgi:hypothetical protein